MQSPQKPLRLPESTHDPWTGVGSYVVKCGPCRRKNRSPGSRQTSHATQGGTPEPRGEQLPNYLINSPEAGHLSPEYKSTKFPVWWQK